MFSVLVLFFFLLRISRLGLPELVDVRWIGSCGDAGFWRQVANMKDLQKGDVEVQDSGGSLEHVFTHVFLGPLLLLLALQV